jgi:hypothetical protein
MSALARIRTCLHASGQVSHGGSRDSPVLSPRTRRHSLSLFVTNVNPATTACAAIQRSLFPIISRLASSSARIDPYASAADSGKESAGSTCTSSRKHGFNGSNRHPNKSASRAGL